MKSPDIAPLSPVPESVPAEVPAVVARNITCDFGPGKGVFDVSLRLNWGHVVGIIGANGSGKTTLVRCLSLFQPIATGGSIHWAGETWADGKKNGSEYCQGRSVDKLRGRVLAVVFQQAEPWPHLHVLDNVMLALRRVAGQSVAESKSIAEESLDLFGILDRAYSMPHQLSGGLRQRVTLARAFALRPRILVLDEAASALDPEWTERLRLLIRRFADEGGAVIHISHRLGFVRHVSDSVIYLEDGRIVEQGDPESVLNRPTSERLKKLIENA
jgi:ABC-type polar amino acid transport system ATPase subunit